MLVRADLNVPLADGRVTDDARIAASVPTIRAPAGRRRGVAVCSHLGRPKGAVVPELSLAPCAARLGELLGRPVELLPDCVGDAVRARVESLAPGEVVAAREPAVPRRGGGERPGVRRRSSPHGFTHYVNDAFGAAHRAHASTEGVARLLPACAGLLDGDARSTC